MDDIIETRLAQAPQGAARTRARQADQRDPAVARQLRRVEARKRHVLRSRHMAPAVFAGLAHVNQFDRAGVEFLAQVVETDDVGRGRRVRTAEESGKEYRPAFYSAAGAENCV